MRPWRRARPSDNTTRRSPILARFGAVLIGYVSACLMAGLVLLLGAAAPHGLLAEQFGFTGNVVSTSLFVVGLLSVFVAALAAAPVLAGVVVGELLVIRSIFYYTLGGGLVAGLGYYWAASHGMVPLDDIEQRTSETILLTAAGLIAGFSYWAVTGRKAGVTRHLRD